MKTINVIQYSSRYVVEVKRPTKKELERELEIKELMQTIRDFNDFVEENYE